MHFTTSNTSEFLHKALLFACEHSDAVVLLNGNELPYRFDPFPITLAFGCKNQVRSNGSNSFSILKNFHSQSTSPIFGYFGYDLKNEIESLESNHIDLIGFDNMFFFEPEHIITLSGPTISITKSKASPETLFSSINNCIISAPNAQESFKEFNNFTKEEYIQTIKNLQELIARGDIYEINFCISYFSKEFNLDPVETYLRLNKISPMPFSCFVKDKDKFLLCASPERFIKKTGQKLISQPIKGTAKRGSSLNEDLELKAQLVSSDKEKAENMMIVDLVRNDLSHTAKDGSVNVDELCGIYTFPQVHQMISTVIATQSKSFHFIDTIQNCFPMGSMTGAPKINAMRFIEKFEKSKRGLFSGSVGYISPEGNFDFNVIIRSILYNQTKQNVCFQAGSAITSDAIPEKEWQECEVKTKAIREVLGILSKP